MTIETSMDLQRKLPRWTTHPRRLPADSYLDKKPVIENGVLVFQPGEGEVVQKISQNDGLRIAVDVTGGRRQIVYMYDLREEATGVSRHLAKALDWFDHTRLGRWWNAAPSA